MNRHLTNYQETVSGICSNLSELTSKIEGLKCMGYKLSIYNGLDLNNSNGKLFNYLDELNKTILDIHTSFAKCEQLTKRCLSYSTHKVGWLPKRSKRLQVILLDGLDPWSFWVTYKSKTELNAHLKKLRKKYEGGLLISFDDSPEVGSFVYCIDRQLLFRGVIIAQLLDNRFKILNIDINCIKVMKLDNLFQTDSDLCELHAFAVHCCLLENSKGKVLWNEELSEIFRSALRECELEINVTQEIESLPPKFVVQLYGYNEALGASANLSNWIVHRLLPALKESSSSEGISDIGVVANVPETVLDPYDSTRVHTEQLHSTVLLKEFACSDQPVLDSIVVKAEVKPLNGKQQVSNMADFNKIAYLNSGNKIAPIEDAAPLLESRKPDKNIDCKLNKKKKNKNKGQNYHSSLIVSKNKIVQNSNTEEFMKESHEIYKALPTSDILDDKNFNKRDIIIEDDEVSQVCGGLETMTEIEEICEQYQPKDEIRICQFFAKKGYCWKINCTKKHEKNPTGKWTMDIVDGFKDITNKLIMPEIGTTVNLSVATVISANSFYAFLPNKYSVTEMEDYEGGKYETLASLISLMNFQSTVAKLEFLEADPVLGELILAFGARSLWQRARVIEVFDDSIEVFYIDFGESEIIAEKHNLRKLLPEFLHLPSQAVLCYLSDLYLNDNDLLQKKGRHYLEELILKDNIKAKVIKSNVLDSELELVVYNSQNININEALVLGGYCIQL